MHSAAAPGCVRRLLFWLVCILLIINTLPIFLGSICAEDFREVTDTQHIIGQPRFRLSRHPEWIKWALRIITLIGKVLIHTHLHTIPRSIFERGIYGNRLMLNTLVVTLGVLYE